MTLHIRWQVEKEYLVEAPAPQQFRRQAGNVVGGGDDEYRLGFLLHPRQDGAEHPQRSATVAIAGTEPLFDLVDPQDTGRHGFGQFERAPGIFFRLSDQVAEQGTDVEPQQRQTPQRGDGLGRQRFAAAGNADQSYALGRRQPIGLCLATEGAGTLAQPLLQGIEPADIANRLDCMEQLQRPGRAHQVLFFADHQIEIVDIESAAGDDGPGEHPLRLSAGKSERGTQQFLILLGRQTGLDARRLQQMLENGVEFRQFGRRAIEHHRIVLQLLRDRARRHSHDEAFVHELEALRQIAQLANDSRLALPALVKVTQHDHNLALQPIYRVQRG